MHSEDEQSALGNELDVSIAYPKRFVDKPYQTDADEGGTEIEQGHTAQLEAERNDGTIEAHETETGGKTYGDDDITENRRSTAKGKVNNGQTVQDLLRLILTHKDAHHEEGETDDGFEYLEVVHLGLHGGIAMEQQDKKDAADGKKVAAPTWQGCINHAHDEQREKEPHRATGHGKVPLQAP